MNIIIIYNCLLYICHLLSTIESLIVDENYCASLDTNNSLYDLQDIGGKKIAISWRIMRYFFKLVQVSLNGLRIATISSWNGDRNVKNIFISFVHITLESETNYYVPCNVQPIGNFLLELSTYCVIGLRNSSTYHYNIYI